MSIFMYSEVSYQYLGVRYEDFIPNLRFIANQGSHFRDDDLHPCPTNLYDPDILVCLALILGERVIIRLTIACMPSHKHNPLNNDIFVMTFIKLQSDQCISAAGSN